MTLDEDQNLNQSPSIGGGDSFAMNNQPTNPISPISNPVELGDQSFAQMPTRRSWIKILISVLAAIITMSGVAYGAWFGYNKYFATPKLDDLMFNAIQKINQLDTYQVDYDASLTYQPTGKAVASSSVLNVMSGVLGTGDVQEATIKGRELIDQTDSNNKKSEGDVVVSGPSGFVIASLGYKIIGETIYLKLANLPLAVSAFIKTDLIENKWLKVDQQLGSDILNSSIKEETENSKLDWEALREAYGEGGVLHQTKDCEVSKTDDEKTITCDFQIVGTAFKDFVYKYGQLTNNNEYQTQLDKVKTEDWDKVSQYLNNILFTATFTGNDLMLTNLEMVYTPTSSEIIKKVALKLKLSNFNAALNIIAPDDSTDIKSILTELVSSVNFGSNSNSIDATYSDLITAKAKARDAKRLADVKQIQTALELYYSGNDKYPLVKDKVVLGEGDYACLSEQGFGAVNNCSGMAIMSTIPANPTPGGQDYAYVCPDGVNYQISYALEQSLNAIKAGPQIASPEGVASNMISDYYSQKNIPADTGLVTLEDSKRISSIKQIQTALELYYNDHNQYPIIKDEVVLGEGSYACLGGQGFGIANTCQTKAYMNNIPTNPTPGGQDYIYTCPDGQNYKITFSIDQNYNSYKAGKLVATPSGIAQVSSPASISDVDGDGLSDSDELLIYHTNPTNPDTDGDGYTDGEEVANGYNPNGPGKLQ